jgi:hypothetical protein
MKVDRELLLRWLEEDLTPAERVRVRLRLEAEPDMRAELERLRALQQAVSESGQPTFAPFFSDRVMRRLAAAEAEAEAASESLYESLRWAFARVAVACLVLAVALGTYSAAGRGSDLSTGFLDSVLGLPATTLDTALLLGAA